MVTNIKDMTPNQDLIDQLEIMLEQARRGEIRSLLTIKGWNDDCVTHGWSIDKRNSARRMLAEMVLLQHNYVDKIGFDERDSVLNNAFEHWE